MAGKHRQSARNRLAQERVRVMGERNCAPLPSERPASLADLPMPAWSQAAGRFLKSGSRRREEAGALGAVFTGKVSPPRRLHLARPRGALLEVAGHLASFRDVEDALFLAVRVLLGADAARVAVADVDRLADILGNPGREGHEHAALFHAIFIAAC
jgi:hypothetical protein